MDATSGTLHGEEMKDKANEIFALLDKAGYKQVIYCKDCKYRNTHQCYMIYGLRKLEDKDYCSNGEKA